MAKRKNLAYHPKAIMVFLAASVLITSVVILALWRMETERANEQRKALYRSSAEQIAALIAYPVAFFNRGETERVIQQSLVAKRATYIEVTNQKLGSVVRQGLLVEACPTGLVRIPINYHDRVIGQLKYCLDKSLFGGMSHFASFTAIIILFLLISLSAILALRLSTQSISQMLNDLDGIDVDKPCNSIGAFKSVDSFLGPLATKIEALLVRLDEQYKQKEDKSRYETIVRTIQMLAHDLRAPFTTITSFIRLLSQCKSRAEFLQLRMQLEPEMKARFNYVESMLSNIISLETSGKRPRCALSGARILYRCLTDICREKIKDDCLGISFQIDLQHQHKIHGEIVQIQRIFQNILANAFEASPPRGRIWISAMEEDLGTIVWRIGNYAKKLSEINRAQVFEPFFTSDKKNGTGLGLAICKQLVQDHGGQIRCDNVENGVEFVFTLPSTPGTCDETISRWPSSVREIIEQHKLARPSPGLVLVEDNPFVTMEWQQYFGETIRCFSRPEALLEAVDRNDVDLADFHCIVTDFHFGNSRKYDGAKLAEILRSMNRKLNILLASDGIADDFDSKLFSDIVAKDPRALPHRYKLVPSNGH